MNTLLVTGGAGFIGSAFVREALHRGDRVIIYDALTYAGHLPNVESCLDEGGRCEFVRGDIRDAERLSATLTRFNVTHVVNFAAETHVDNSILGPKPFLETNVMGTFHLLEACRAYVSDKRNTETFRLLHVSTDEVFGELEDEGFFTEQSAYRPNSPYSASKAASDHLVRAWSHTYNLPIVITNCSNNYGPRQFPEKLIPRMITCALNLQPLPVYGEGSNIRDWIHVEDHARGVYLALFKGQLGQSYCFGGRSERRNLSVVETLCAQLDQLQPRQDGQSYARQITFVKDRLGHDWRYAIDDTKAERELGFERAYPRFEDGLKHTIEWYLDHPEWLTSVLVKGTSTDMFTPTDLMTAGESHP